MLEEGRMILVGIVTDESGEEYISSVFENNECLSRYHITYIKENNIENIKNIKFDIVIINRKFNKWMILNEILKKTKFIILNGDMDNNTQLMDEISGSVITYGYNSKCTVTVSSVTEDSALICLQRNIICNSEEIEQQEVRINKQDIGRMYDIMSITTTIIIYNKCDINHVKF